MRKLVEQGVLLAAGTGLCLVWLGINGRSLGLSLLALILCCLPTILQRQKKQTGKEAVTDKSMIYRYIYPFVLLGIIGEPSMAFFLPVLMYELWECDCRITLVEAIGVLVWFLLRYRGMEGIALIFCGIFSVLLSVEHKSAAKHKKDYIVLMDASSEQNLLLNRSNQKLMEAQDVNIHIAMLEERNRIAREIHDNVGHLITRALLQTGALEAMNREEAVAPTIAGVKETLNTAMTSIRASVHDMHDETIHLEQTLQDLLEETDRFETELIYDCGAFLPKQVKYAIVAICREAFNNAMKYSNGTKFQILLREHPSFYQLVVSDNGTEIGKEMDTSGIGLTNIRDRVQAVNGTVHFSTKQGFQIHITMIKEK